MNKEKCAFDRIDKCVALKEKQCKGCTYYKTADQLSADREKIKTTACRYRRAWVDRQIRDIVGV